MFFASYTQFSWNWETTLYYLFIYWCAKLMLIIKKMLENNSTLAFNSYNRGFRPISVWSSVTTSGGILVHPFQKPKRLHDIGCRSLEAA